MLKINYGMKTLTSTGTSKTFTVPAKWLKFIGTHQYFDVESTNDILTIRPHK